MHTKYHGGTPKTCIGKKLHKTLHFFMDFTDFACFGHGLDSFLKASPPIDDYKESVRNRKSRPWGTHL